MLEWNPEWGDRPRRIVKPYGWPPTRIARQAGSAFAVSLLTKWAGLPRWIVRYGIRCLPGAAGSRGMGCIGFPAHPVWEMTRACNLSCIHCHASGGIADDDQLDTREGKNLLDELAGVPEFRMMAFTGGEPLLRDDLFELLAYSRALGFANTLATNATLIDDAAARELRRCGVVIGAISLDGFDAETHDRGRGQAGAFEKTLQGARALRRAGIVLHVNITAMSYNLDQIEPLTEMVDELGAGILLMYQLVPVGRGRAIDDAVLGRAENERLVRFLAEAQRRSGAIIEPVAAPQYWAYLLQQAGIRGGVRLRLAEGLLHGCAAGRGFAYVKPNGDVWACPFLEETAGNVRDAPFGEIWRSAPLFSMLRQRETKLEGRCGPCDYNRVCGGCRSRAWAITGRALAEDPSCFLDLDLDPDRGPDLGLDPDADRASKEEDGRAA